MPILARYNRTLYVEPFCGAGGLFFGKPQESAEILNDANGCIVALLRVLRDEDKRRELDELLEMSPMSRALWYEARDIGRAYMRGESIEKRKIAARLEFYTDETVAAYCLLYCQWYGFAGDVFGAFGGGCKGAGAARVIGYGARRKKALADYSARLATVTIEGLDAIECLRKYDAPGTLFYVDPPYLTASKHGAPGRAYRGCNVDQIKLVETLYNLKGSFVLSCYDAPIFEQLHDRAHKFQFSATTSLARNYRAAKEFERVETVYASRFTR
ncbi:DNA adenine methylase [Candidatus Saccharibacteria bacterium]|nr:DNA adenine methylase [Candidatus Saccharibacteria bacterium]